MGDGSRPRGAASQAASTTTARISVPNRPDNVRDRWRRTLLRTRRVNPTVVLTLLAMLPEMKPNGHVSVPVETITQRRSLAKRAVGGHVAAAIDAGLLDRVSRGVRGSTAVYAAILPDRRQGADSVHPVGVEQGARSKHPVGAETVHPIESGPSTYVRALGADSVRASSKEEVVGTSMLVGEELTDEEQVSGPALPSSLLSPVVRLVTDSVGLSDAAFVSSLNDDLRRCATCTGYVLHDFGGDRCGMCITADRRAERRRRERDELERIWALAAEKGASA